MSFSSQIGNTFNATKHILVSDKTKTKTGICYASSMRPLLDLYVHIFICNILSRYGVVLQSQRFQMSSDLHEFRQPWMVGWVWIQMRYKEEEQKEKNAKDGDGEQTRFKDRIRSEDKIVKMWMRRSQVGIVILQIRLSVH